MTAATSSDRGSRKKRVPTTRTSAQERDLSASPQPSLESSPSPQNGVTASTAIFRPIDSFSHPPSTSYLDALKQIQEFKRQVQDELAYIAAESARTRGQSGSNRNSLETPRKKLLSAQVELARMDWMEQPEVADILYKATHFGDDLAGKAAFEATQQMKECQHILDLYEDLRKHLAVKTRKRAMIYDIGTLLLCLSYTAIAIPFFCIALALSYFNPLWTTLFNARNHFQPVDLIQKFYARGFLWLCQIKVTWIGTEHVNYDASTLGMFSHASNLDPIIVASGPLAWKWIGKKSLFRIPVIGWILSALEHIPIERENREKAIASLKKAAEIIHTHKRCVAISPEGTRSKSGRIQDFKKGAFHTALEVGVPITPLLIEGAFDLWPSGSIFAQPGNVSVTLLKPIQVVKGKEDYNLLASKVRRAFFEALLKSAQKQLKEEKKGE